MTPGRVVITAYVFLVFLQPGWHALLPPPAGSGSAALAAIATIPLLILLRGVVALQIRTLTIAGFLVLIYFVVGIMEAWSNPDQRWPALLQVAISTAYVAGLAAFSRRLQRPAPRL